MRILFVSNHETERCGVAEFGRQHCDALRALGHEVEQWHPKPERHGWPHNFASGGYDVVHVNYHPGTINYLTPPPAKPRMLSAFWHEPGLGGDFGPVDVGFGAEPAANVNMVVPMPMVDYVPRTYDKLGHRDNWLIGTSTLRGQGVPELQSVLDRRYNTLDAGGSGWLPTNEEVNRLGTCDFLVFWYGGANRGQSAAVCMGIAAQRPIILSKNRMFDSFLPYAADEFYFVDQFESGIELVKWDLRLGTARIPRKARRDRLWSVQAARIASEWSRLLEIRR